MRCPANLGLAVAFDHHAGQGAPEEAEDGGRERRTSTGQQFHMTAQFLSEFLEDDLVEQRVSLVDKAVDLFLLDTQRFSE